MPTSCNPQYPGCSSGWPSGSLCLFLPLKATFADNSFALCHPSCRSGCHALLQRSVHLDIWLLLRIFPLRTWRDCHTAALNSSLTEKASSPHCYPNSWSCVQSHRQGNLHYNLLWRSWQLGKCTNQAKDTFPGFTQQTWANILFGRDSPKDKKKCASVWNQCD